MSNSYAAGTEVPASRSRDEIERTLVRFGASEFAYAWSAGSAVIGFVAGGRQVRFTLPMPDRNDKRFRLTEAGRARSASAQEQAYEQAARQRWRALALAIKAKLAAIEAGITTFEEEFGMRMVLPGGATVSEHVIPAITEAYETGELPALLPGPSR